MNRSIVGHMRKFNLLDILLFKRRPGSHLREIILAFDAIRVDSSMSVGSIKWSLLNVLSLLDLPIFLQLVNVCLTTFKAFEKSPDSIHECQKNYEENKANHR